MEFPQSCRRAGPLHLVCMFPLLGKSSPPSFIPNLVNPYSSCRTQLQVTFFQTLPRPFQSGLGASRVCDLEVPGRPSYYTFCHILLLSPLVDSKMLYIGIDWRVFCIQWNAQQLTLLLSFYEKNIKAQNVSIPSESPLIPPQATPTPRSKSSSAFHHHRFPLLILEQNGIRHCLSVCGLFSSTQHVIIEVHLCCCMNPRVAPIYYWIIFHWHIHHLLIHSSLDGHLAYF